MSSAEVKLPECFSNYDSTSHQCVHCGHKGCFDAYRTKRKSVAAEVTNQDQVGGDHYRKAEITPWDVWDTWPIEQRIGAYRSNAVKYLMRMGTKDERIQEAKKCLHYVQKLIEVLENA